MPAIKSILVATDFGEPSRAALHYGLELARQFKATLHVLHVVDDLSAFPLPVGHEPGEAEQTQLTLEEAARETLQRLVPEPDRTALHAHLVVMTSMTPENSILHYAQEAGIDLIVVGTHGRKGLPRFLIGSVAQHVTRAAACPVLTARTLSRCSVQHSASIGA